MLNLGTKILYISPSKILLLIGFLGLAYILVKVILRYFLLQKLHNITSLQEEFIGNLSHELKHPLTRAITSLEALEIETGKIDKLDKIKDDLFLAAELLENLLSISFLKKQGAPGGLAILTKCFESVEDQLRAEILARDLKIDKVWLYTGELLIPQPYLEMIFINLLSNSIKYSYPVSTIYLKSYQEEKWVIFKISDQGIGFDLTTQRNLFKRFYRSKEAVKVSDGNGLGLSIVKQICDLYKIKINLESKKGRGTEVTLTFPIFDRA